MLQKNKYPWIVSMEEVGTGFVCGGTLVASKYVVTATSCLFLDPAGTQPMNTSDVQVMCQYGNMCQHINMSLHFICLLVNI